MATQKKDTTKKTNKKPTAVKTVSPAKKQKAKAARTKTAGTTQNKTKSKSVKKDSKKPKTGTDKTVRNKKTIDKKTVKSGTKAVRRVSVRKAKPVLDEIVSIQAQTIETVREESRLPQIPPEKEGAYRLAKRISRLMLEKKAERVSILDVGKLTGVMDYFVIASGTADIHIKAITDHVIDTLEKEGEKPHHIEGTMAYKWVLIDYIDVVVHIFENETRSFYDLERLWGDAQFIPVHDTAEN